MAIIVHTKRRRMWWLAAAVLVAVAGVAIWCQTTPKPVDPRTVALPAPSADPKLVRAYFQAKGKALVPMLQATTELPAETTKTACLDLAGRLNTLAGPKELAAAAAAVPDQVIASAALNHVDTVTSYLAACGSAEDISGPAAQARFSATVLTRLLVQEGVL